MSLLIVHRDADMAEELRHWATSLAVAWDSPFRLCHDFETARADLASNGPPAGLVVEVDLPPEGRHAGLALAREMRERWTAGKAIPVLLVAPMLDADLSNAITGMPDCMVVCEGGNLERDYRYALRCLLAVGDGQGDAPVAADPGYNIHIRVNANGDCSYEVRSLNAPVNLATRLRFGVDPKRLQALMAAVPTKSAGTDWIDKYRTIGEELMQALFREQADVYQELGVLRGLKMAAPATRLGLCFSVDREFYRIPFEALGGLNTAGDFRYWMEDWPLWRSLPEYARGGRSLFSRSEGSPQPLNCLLINASCGGQVRLPDPSQGPDARTTWQMSALPHAEDEIDEILDVLMEAMPARVGRVGVIEMENGTVQSTIWGPGQQGRPRPHREPFDQVLERLLTEGGPWHMVHFAGHSHFVGPEGSEIGYVFVPQRGAQPHDMPSPKALGIARMAAWLEDARFVFLSGCSSSHREFVYHLCARNVPAMSGYPWPILDDIAWQHSAHFYRQLLRLRSIEKALQASWLAMYASFSHAWAWASSQFVIQET